MPAANFPNGNLVKEKDSRQAKRIFVNRSKSSTYGMKISKLCDSTQKSLVGSYVHSLLNVLGPGVLNLEPPSVVLSLIVSIFSLAFSMS